MSNAVVQVQYDALHRIAQELAQHAQNVKQMASHIETSTDDLCRFGWEGDNAEAFKEDMHNTVIPAVYRLANALYDAENTTLRIIDVFQEAEEETKSVFGGGTSPEISSGTQLPGGIAAWLKNNSNIVNLVKNFLSLASRDLGDQHQLAEFIAIKGAGQLAAMTTTKKGFENVLKFINSKAFTSSVSIGGGLIGGMIDFATGGEYTGKEFATQTISGVIQGVITLNPKGALVLFGNTVVQFGGGLILQGLKVSADLIAGGDPVRAQRINQAIDRFDRGLNAIDLDQRLDGVVRSVIDGDMRGVVREGITFLKGVFDVTVAGSELMSHTPLARPYDRFIASTAPVMVPLVDQVDQAVDDALKFFSVN